MESVLQNKYGILLKMQTNNLVFYATHIHKYTAIKHTVIVEIGSESVQAREKKVYSNYLKSIINRLILHPSTARL